MSRWVVDELGLIAAQHNAQLPVSTHKTLAVEVFTPDYTIEKMQYVHSKPH